MDSDEKFDQQMDALTREIGERGLNGAAEGVPPLRRRTNASTPAGGGATAAADVQTRTAALHDAQMTMHHQLSSSTAAESSPALLVERLLDDARSDRAVMTATLAQQHADLTANFSAFKAELVLANAPQNPVHAIEDGKLAVLLGRLEGCHAANLVRTHATLTPHDRTRAILSVYSCTCTQERRPCDDSLPTRSCLSSRTLSVILRSSEPRWRCVLHFVPR